MNILNALKVLMDFSVRTTVPTRRHEIKFDRKVTRSATKTIVEEILGTQCVLRPGSIVACDLGLGLLDHTGIYIGRNRIVERNGCGTIKKVSIDDFINSSTLRTGVTLYAACANGKVIADSEIAKRARNAVGKDSGYHLIDNNCHRLTAYLATGSRHNITTFLALASLLDTKYPGLEWKSAIVR